MPSRPSRPVRTAPDAPSASRPTRAGRQALDLAFAERPAGIPLHRWAYDNVRAAILEGRLGPGARLPSTRDLARQLDVSRGTLVSVFEQLAAEGYLTSREGSGTFVAQDLPDAWFEVHAPARARPGRHAASLSRFGRGLTASPFPLRTPAAAHPFRAHIPAIDAFPHDLWSRIVARQARRETRAGLQGGEAAGLRSLRSAIADHLRVTRGVDCTADHVIITSGSQQSLDLAARLILDPGDRAWMEDPGYVGARAVLEAAGADVVPIPVDEQGLRVDVGIARAPNAKLAFVTPAHQAPLGVTLPADRRMALLDWAADHGAWIVEDDYDSEFRYERRPVAALVALDRRGVVIHLGSFSKTMFPGLRLAYVVAPESLRDRFVAAKSALDRFTPPLTQAALAEFITAGHFARHLRRMRELYSERRTALLEALASEMGPDLEVIGADAGIDVAAWLPEGVDDVEAVRLLAGAGIDAMPLSSDGVRPRSRGGLLLGFASFSPAKLRAAVVTMARVLAPLLRDAHGSRVAAAATAEKKKPAKRDRRDRRDRP